MPIDDRDIDDGAGHGASRLLAGAAAADLDADRRLALATADFAMPADARLDDRTHAAMASAVGDLIRSVETGVRRHASRLLDGAGVDALVEALATPIDRSPPPVRQLLVDAGLLRDQALMREVFGRVRHDLLDAALPQGPAQRDRPSLLARLTDHDDGAVASGAIALLAAESRRRLPRPVVFAASDLPAELHHLVVWAVAAALRLVYLKLAVGCIDRFDRALADAAIRSIAAHDEGERLEAVAMRVASTLDARPREVAALLVEALGDRRLSLFTALLAHGVGVDFADARDAVLDPAGNRLWLMLRTLDTSRDDIARIALALSDADPRRDIEALADLLDELAALSRTDARAALWSMTLPVAYRNAITMIARQARPWT